MPPEFSCRVFPPEVISNTFDFDVRRVTHDGRRMRGVFARRRIEDDGCALFIGYYPGHRRSTAEMDAKAAGYAARHTVDALSAGRATSAYVLSLNRPDPGFVLDPADAEGALLPDFAPGIVLYWNENPPGRVPQASFVWNLPLRRYEVWLQRSVEADEEIFLFYGKRYFRDYPVDAEAGTDKPYYRIPEGGVFKPDPRGIPAPLALPPDGGSSPGE
jgi:hypothetical protein